MSVSLMRVTMCFVRDVWTYRVVFELFSVCFFFFFKQKTAYEMRISDWSSDVCSSDLWAEVWLEGRGWVCAPGERAVADPYPEDIYSEIGRASCRERVCQYV